MKDQAERLRDIVRKRAEEIEHEITLPVRVKTRVLVVTGGKGGVGKTNFALNLAIAMAKMRRRVILMDADMGLANIDIILGLMPQYNLWHVVRGTKRIGEILIDGPSGIRIIPGGSGVQELANISETEMENVIHEIGSLEGEADFFIIDTGAGISNSVIGFLLAADEVIVLTTPEPTAIADAYGLIKTAFLNDVSSNINLVVNRVANDLEGTRAAERLMGVVNKFLGKNINYLGCVADDELVTKAVRRQEVFIDYPESRAARDVYRIANILLQNEDDGLVKPSGIRNFIKTLSSFWR